MQSPRTTAIDASHRVEPVSAVVVCAANVQANTVVFFFPAFSNAPGVKGGGEGFPVLCDAPRMGIPVSPPPLCRGTPAMHKMRRLPGELYVNGSILLMFFFFFFLSRTAVLNFSFFFFCNLWTCFLFFMRERLGNGVGWREDTQYIWVSTAFSLLIPGLKTGFKLVACLLFEHGPVVRGFSTFLLCKSSTSHLPVKERIWEYSFQE